MPSRKQKSPTYYDDEDWERLIPPEHIAAEAAKIRAGWDRVTTLKRAGLEVNPTRCPRMVSMVRGRKFCMEVGLCDP
jgi:hypothetical protein